MTEDEARTLAIQSLAELPAKYGNYTVVYDMIYAGLSPFANPGENSYWVSDRDNYVEMLSYDEAVEAIVSFLTHPLPCIDAVVVGGEWVEF